MTPLHLAWANLTHQWVRSLISVLGVGFAVLMVFLQLGFKESLREGAVLIYSQLDFDLILISSEYTDFNRAGTIPRARLAQARVPGVKESQPLSAMLGLWRDPRPGPPTEPRPNWSLLVLAVDPVKAEDLFPPTGKVFRNPAECHDLLNRLLKRDTVLVDYSSWPEYGGPEEMKPGKVHELNGRNVQIVGGLLLGTSFGYNGLVLCSEETFDRLTGRSGSVVSMGLLKLEENADPLAVQKAVRDKLFHTKDVQVLTREEIIKKEQDYWMTQTAVGMFFTMGVIVAVAVGGLFVYQMMSADVRQHLSEYATAKAMGSEPRFLIWVVVDHAILLGMFGYLPGLIGAMIVYDLTARTARIPLEMTGQRALVVLALAVGMCLVGGVWSARRVHRADPAELFS